MYARIFIEGSRSLDVVDNPEKIIDGMGIFLPAQSVVLQRTALCQALGGAFANPPREHVNNLANLARCRLHFILRRHLAGVDAEPHFAPFFRDQRICEIGPKVVEAELSLLLFAVVTPHAVRLEKGPMSFERWVGRAQGRKATKYRKPENLFFHNSLLSAVRRFLRPIGLSGFPLESRQGGRARSEPVHFRAHVLQHGQEQVTGLHSFEFPFGQHDVLTQCESAAG